MKVYIDARDWWIGYYRGDTHHYVCILPTVVMRWPRRLPAWSAILEPPKFCPSCGAALPPQ